MFESLRAACESAALSLIKQSSRRAAGAFGCTVPCNGVFSGCLAIRFYPIRGKTLHKTLSRRVCFAPVGMGAHSTLGIAAYILRCVCAAQRRVGLRCYTGAGTLRCDAINVLSRDLNAVEIAQRHINAEYYFTLSWAERHNEARSITLVNHFLSMALRTFHNSAHTSRKLFGLKYIHVKDLSRKIISMFAEIYSRECQRVCKTRGTTRWPLGV